MEKASTREQAVLISLHSATLEGNIAKRVDVEVSFTKGLPNFSIVGLPNESIKESKERVKSALLTNNYTFPPLRITINLSPSDLKKEGSHFDLPIALLIASNKKELSAELPKRLYVFGEVGLEGRIKDTASIYPIALSLAKEGGFLTVLTSTASAKKLGNIPNMTVYGVKDLQEALAFLQDPRKFKPIPRNAIRSQKIELDQPYYYERGQGDDFAQVIGQEQAKRAALISAAGMHNVLFSGSPGSGKSMIIKRMAGILPPMSLSEVLEASLRLAEEGKEPDFIPRRPFRQPHHTATRASIFGGGSRQSRMGEVALANGGILFFDELPHFPKSILEALREPLEDHRLLISRVNTKVEYEAAFLFAAAMNPCPCGNLLSHTKACRCTDQEIQRYKNRLSEPFLDRIDLYVEMDETGTETGRIDSVSMQQMVMDAFRMQKKRGQTKLNGKMDDRDIARFCIMEPEAEGVLERGGRQYGLSMRSLNKVRKVARTIADFDGSERIRKKDVMEALRFRYRS